MKLIIATRNRHKLDEIRAILRLPGLDIVGVAEHPVPLPEVVEDGVTFHANAIKKAMTLALASRLWTLADDSGLEVEALGDEPGVLSARYAGEPANDAANNAKLLAKLASAPDRRARFRCVIALCSPTGRAQFVEGVCAGTLASAPRGTLGFGYDPLFVPDGYTQTFAELDAEAKNRLSHRAQALQRATELWGQLLAGSATDWPARQ